MISQGRNNETGMREGGREGGRKRENGRGREGGEREMWSGNGVIILLRMEGGKKDKVQYADRGRLSGMGNTQYTHMERLLFMHFCAHTCVTVCTCTLVNQ